MASGHKADHERFNQESELSGRVQEAKNSENGIKEGARDDSAQ